MYAVSLLPREYVESRSAAKKGKLAMLACITLVVVLAFTLAILNMMSASLNQELESLKNSNDVMARRIGALKTVEELMDDVTYLSEKVSNLSASYPEWDAIIPRMGNALPPTVFLTSLKAEFKEGKTSIVIEGRAPDHKTVTGMIESLSGNPEFGEITCSFSKADPSSGNIQFELNIPVIYANKLQNGGNGT